MQYCGHSKLHTVFILFCHSYSFIPYVAFFLSHIKVHTICHIICSLSKFLTICNKICDLWLNNKFQTICHIFHQFSVFVPFATLLCHPSKFYTIYIIFLDIQHLLSTIIYYLLSVTIYIYIYI